MPDPRDEDGNPVEKTVSSIRVICAYETNINTAHFDNISLVREIAQTMKYDDDGNLVCVNSTGLKEDENTYENGNLIRTVTGGQGTYEYTYDQNLPHRLKSVTNGLITQSMSHDGVGNVNQTTLKPAEGDTPYMQTSAAYTNSGNLLSSVTDAAGSTVTYGYEEYKSGDTVLTSAASSRMWGLPTLVTDPDGNETWTAYDQFARVQKTNVAGLATLEYTYSSGNLASFTRTHLANSSARRQTYTLAYNTFGSNTSIKIGNRMLAQFSYYPNNGPLQTQTYGPNGVSVSYEYDILGRVKKATWSDGLVLTYAYNGEGTLSSITAAEDGAETKYLYSYDSLGRLIHSQRKDSGVSVLRTTQGYDDTNRLACQSWQVGNNIYSESYTYNSGQDGSLNTHTTATGQTLTYHYDSLRRLSSITGGIYGKSYTYRYLNNTTQTTSQVAVVLYDLPTDQSFGYTYNDMGNIATYTDANGTVTYTYDDLGQLKKAAGTTTYSYTYDSAGNILTANGHSYTYGDADWPDLLTKYDGVAITYDSIGNPTSYYNGTQWTFSWEHGRVLSTASGGGSSISYTYDADGIRTSKTVNGTKHTYYYAGGKLLRETFGSNTLDFFYDVSGNPYALKHNGTTYYYITNLQGDVMSIVNGSGTVVASYQYDPFGNLVSTEPTANSIGAINPLRYRGYVYDTESRLYYLQSRYYDPKVGRFINADVLVSTGQGILGYNMFAYCRNNPASRVDVSGYIDEEVDLDGETKDDLFPEPIGGGTISSDHPSGQQTGNTSSPSSGSRLSVTSNSKGTHQIIGGTPSGVPTDVHHIVERCQRQKTGFTQENIEGYSNKVAIPREVHQKISGYYSSYQDITNGVRVRDWLKGQSFEQQTQFGWQVIERFWEEFYGH